MKEEIERKKREEEEKKKEEQERKKAAKKEAEDAKAAAAAAKKVEEARKKVRFLKNVCRACSFCPGSRLSITFSRRSKLGNILSFLLFFVEESYSKQLFAGRRKTRSRRGEGIEEEGRETEKG